MWVIGSSIRSNPLTGHHLILWKKNLPETNSSHLKMDGWNISFLLVSGRVTVTVDGCRNPVMHQLMAGKYHHYLRRVSYMLGGAGCLWHSIQEITSKCSKSIQRDHCRRLDMRNKKAETTIMPALKQTTWPTPLVKIRYTIKTQKTQIILDRKQMNEIWLNNINKSYLLYINYVLFVCVFLLSIESWKTNSSFTSCHRCGPWIDNCALAWSHICQATPGRVGVQQFWRWLIHILTYIDFLKVAGNKSPNGSLMVIYHGRK